jgi:hypothetical protein
MTRARAQHPRQLTSSASLSRYVSRRLRDGIYIAGKLSGFNFIIFVSPPSVLTACHRTLIRAKELEAEERTNIRHSLEDDHAAPRPHGSFSDDPEANIAATTLAEDEERNLEQQNDLDDNIDLAVDDTDDNDTTSSSNKSWDANAKRPYRDSFTDNESDVFAEGDGPDTEAFGLHSHIRH